MNTNNLAFQYKDKEIDCKTHISVKSADYIKAVKLIRAHFQKLNYSTAEAVGFCTYKKKIGAIANVLVRSVELENDLEVACIVDLREGRRMSSRRLLERAFMFLKYWKKAVIFFCHTKGNGAYPIAVKRIFDGDPEQKIDLYSLNLTTGTIDYISRPIKESDKVKKE